MRVPGFVKNFDEVRLRLLWNHALERNLANLPSMRARQRSLGG